MWLAREEASAAAVEVRVRVAYSVWGEEMETETVIPAHIIAQSMYQTQSISLDEATGYAVACIFGGDDVTFHAIERMEV